MTLFREVLAGLHGSPDRRRAVDDADHSPEVLAPWRPLVARLLGAPGERLYHGLVGLPYWEASMALPQALRHPDLDRETWLCLYASPVEPEPFYVALVALREGSLWAGGFVRAIAGDPRPRAVDVEAPALVGAYYGPGLPRTRRECEPLFRAVGECAAILAQLVLEGLGA